MDSQRRRKAIRNHTAVLALVKPKAEVYDNVDYRKKTRNIIAVPAPAAKVA